MKTITKKILSKLIHPAIVMALEQRKENPENFRKIPEQDWIKLSLLERFLLRRENKQRYKRIAKRERQKMYEEIMKDIIDPPEVKKEENYMGALAQSIIGTKQLEMMKVLHNSASIKTKEYDAYADKYREALKKHQP